MLQPRPAHLAARARKPAATGPVTGAERLSRHLAGRDVPCPSCGYNLRGLRTSNCPECGSLLTVGTLGFHRADWRTAAFFVGILGLVAGFIPAGWATLNSAWNLFHAGFISRYSVSLAALLLFAWSGGLAKLLVAWVNWAGTMAAWPRSKHWLAAGACWLAPICGMGVASLFGVRF